MYHYRAVLIAIVFGASFYGSTSQAAGTINCESSGGFVVIRGTDSSAGTAVTGIRFGDREVTDFEVSGVYYNFKTFSFLALDADRNKPVLQVETLVGESEEGRIASGLAWVGEDRNLVPITCQIGY